MNRLHDCSAVVKAFIDLVRRLGSIRQYYGVRCAIVDITGRRAAAAEDGKNRANVIKRGAVGGKNLRFG